MIRTLITIYLYLFFNSEYLQAKSESYLDYPLSFIVDACQITKKRFSPEKEEAEKVLEGRKKYFICMNFVMALTTTLNRRCISFKKEKISPKNSMTFADLSNVQSTTVLINEIIDYSIKNPHFLNQIAWLHASKAISQKWPCI